MKDFEKTVRKLVYEIFTSQGFDVECVAIFLKDDILESLCFGIKYLLFQGDALARENKLLKKMLEDARIIVPPKSILMRKIKICPYCGEPLRTSKSKQCFECHMDWHDPNNAIKYEVTDIESDDSVEGRPDKSKNIDEDDDIDPDEAARRALGLD